jgi:hypothetical protein
MAFASVGGDFNGAVIFDIDFGAGGFGDLANHFTARADHFADLVGSRS